MSSSSSSTSNGKGPGAPAYRPADQEVNNVKMQDGSRVLFATTKTDGTTKMNEYEAGPNTVFQWGSGQ